MTIRTLPLAVSLALSAASAAQAAEPPKLTVYSGDFDAVSQYEPGAGGAGFALYESLVSFNLKAGDTAASLGALPGGLDPSSVLLKPLGTARVRGQRFDFAAAGQDDLLKRALGRTVTVEQSVGDARISHTGTLLSAGNGLTLRLPDGRIKVLAHYASFELAQVDGISHEPTLHWVFAGASGKQDFRLYYSTAGLAWRAEYRIDTLGLGKTCRMGIEGAAMVVNRSGADFDGVGLTLVAGEPNRSGNLERITVTGSRMAAAKMAMADSAPEARVSGEYHAYTLPLPASLPQGSVQRIPLIDAVTGVACERRYETAFAQGDWRPPYPIVDANYGAGDDQVLPVQASLRFKNAKAAGLGMPLPAGRVRIFEGGDFLGEAAIAHTPGNGEVALRIGEVFDLQAKRTRTAFTLDRDGRSMTETVRFDLNNAKKQAVVLRISERLPRWSEWEMVSSSAAFTRRGAQTVDFDLPLAADSTATLTYTVRYRWAPGVKIPD